MDKISAMCAADMSKAHVGRDLCYLDKVERIVDVVWYVTLGPVVWACPDPGDATPQTTTTRGDDEGCVTRHDPRLRGVPRLLDWRPPPPGPFAPCARPPPPLPLPQHLPHPPTRGITPPPSTSGY